MKEFLEAALELTRSARSLVVVSMVQVRGHAPQDLGAKAIITAEGLAWGTIGGGRVEARAIETGLKLLTEPSPPRAQLITWNLQRDIGMTCGGETTYLFETFLAESWPITIFGAGHVAQALARALEPLDFQLTFIDPRKDWLDRLPESEKIKKICHPTPHELVSQFTETSFFICMTRGHTADLPVLHEIFRRYPTAPYIGVIGSEVKAIKLKSELRALGISPTLLERLVCPIGLPIGNNSPAEIAISIAAQLLQARDQVRSTR